MEKGGGGGGGGGGGRESLLAIGNFGGMVTPPMVLVLSCSPTAQCPALLATS